MSSPLPSGVTSRQSRRKASRDKENSLTNDKSGSNLKINHDKLQLSAFQSAIKGLPLAAERDFWKTHRSLAECVMEASRAIPRLAAPSLVLEEHAVDLLNECRRMVKMLSQTATTQQSTKVVLNRLFISVHGIRALATAFVSGSKRDSAIKLSYHAILSSETLCRSAKDDLVSLGRAAFCCLAAYQALAVLLRDYSVSLPQMPTSEMKTFRASSWERPLSFPIPVKATTGEATGSITLVKVLTIGTECTLAVAKVLTSSALWMNRNDLKSTKELETELSSLKDSLQIVLDDDVSHGATERAVSQLLLNVALPWISLVAIASSAKEAATQCKRVHRLLMDAASGLSTGKEFSKLSLSLRGDAVIALLPLSEQSNGAVDSPALDFVLASTFDRACSTAWKAAVEYLKTKRVKDLRFYHERVGAVLDAGATKQSSAPYYEYCAYRALHNGLSTSTPCKSTNCLFRGLSFQCSHKSCDDGDNSADRASLALYFLALYAQNRLENDTRNKDENDSLRRYKLVVERFETVMLTGQGQGAAASILLWYNIFSKLSLHRAVYQALTSNQGSQLDESALGVAATILIRCLGPLAIRCTKSEVLSNEKRPLAWAFITEWFLRGAAAFDRLSSSSNTMEPYREHANSALSEIATLLCTKGLDPPLSCLEGAAKSLAVLGRKRWDAYPSTDAIFPELLRLQLLELQAQNSASFREFQLSTRWSSLCSMFKRLELWDEVLLSATVAILYDMLESATLFDDENAQDLRMRFLRRMETPSKDMTVFGTSDSPLASQNRQKLVQTLLHAIQQRKDGTSPDGTPKPPKFALRPSGALKSLLEARDAQPLTSVFESRCGVAFGFGSCLRAVFTKHATSPFEDIDPKLFSVEVTSTFAEIINGMGLCLQTRSGDGGFTISEYHEICRLGISSTVHIESGDDSVFRKLARALVFAVASMSLLPCFSYVDVDFRDPSANASRNDQLTISYDYLSKASNILAEKVEGNHSAWNLLALSVHMATRVALSQHPHSSRIGADAVVAEARDLVAVFVEYPEDSEVVTAAKNCAVRAIARLSDVLSYQGNAFDAAQTAYWSKEIKPADLSEVMSSWLETTAFLRSLTESVVLTVPTFPVTELSDSSAPVDLETRSTNLLVKTLKTFDNCELKKAEWDFHKLLFDTDAASPGETSAQTRISLLWTRSTALFGLAGCASHRGDLESTLSLLKECFGVCDTLKSSLAIRSRSSAEKINNKLWAEISTSSFYPRTVERQYECLYQLAVTYSRTGDYRKAFTYAECLLSSFGSGLDKGLRGKSNLADLLAFFRITPSANLRDVQLRRLLLSLKSIAIPLDVLCKETEGVKSPLFTALVDCNDRFRASVSIDAEEIFDSLKLCDTIGEYGTVSIEDIRQFYRSLRSKVDKFMQSQTVAALTRILSHQNLLSNVKVSPVVSQHVELGEISLFVSKMSDRHAVNEADIQILRCAASSSSTCNKLRAKALYTLGLIALKYARALGCLQKAWNTEKLDDDESQLLEDAKIHFSASLKLLGTASDLLTRNVLRCLALVSGQSDEASATVCKLINASIGRATRRSVVNAIRGDCPDLTEGKSADKSRICETLECLEYSVDDAGDVHFSSEAFFDEFALLTPKNSRFVSLALCPSGELIGSAIEPSKAHDTFYFNAACVPPQDTSNGNPISIYDQMIGPLDRIVRESEEQLRYTSNPGNDVPNDEEEQKRKWWNKRRFLDSELRDLLDCVEQQIFSSSQMHRIILGSDDDHSITNLASRFEAVCQVDEQVGNRDIDPTLLRVIDLHEELSGYGLEMRHLSQMKKVELVQLVTEERQRRKELKRGNHRVTDREESVSDDDSCIFLILDENLQRFPFESMRCFNGRAVCRLPSLPFAITKFVETSSFDENFPPAIDCSKVSFVLDPDSNLGGTLDRLRPTIRWWSETYGGGYWKGTVGEAPTLDFMEESITEKNGMLLYFGHGSGQQFLPKATLDSLLVADSGRGSRRAESSVILMGCSSAKLVSVNRKGTETEKELPLHYEPEGIALSYICAGAPCVVGNLWDVTDRDIDRFATSFLENFFENGKNRSIAQCVADARSACTLRFMVGCAPVCYGVPVFKQE